jgi:hypothetical protein
MLGGSWLSALSPYLWHEPETFGWNDYVRASLGRRRRVTGKSVHPPHVAKRRKANKAARKARRAGRS